jgi:hypothetical protein
MKVTVVGGGSTYTPELVDGIARLKQMFGVDAQGSHSAFSPSTAIPGRSSLPLILIGR